MPERRMVEKISEKVCKVDEREVDERKVDKTEVNEREVDESKVDGRELLILLLKVGKYSFKKLFLSPQWVQVKFSYTLTSSLILSLDCM